MSCFAAAGSVVDPLAGEAEVDRQHDQPLLGAVVEVALDPVQLARLDVEDGRSALPQRLDLAAKLAALGGAQQTGHDAAMERHDQLRQRAGDEQERADEHGDRSATPRPDGRPGSDAPDASYQSGIVSSDQRRAQATRDDDELDDRQRAG